ncbi:MAG: pyruvate, phosphate dikinase [Acidobacteriota bacterium]|nr:pyruvate, phosphate dikinase [Acidobacteriota bacterium]
MPKYVYAFGGGGAEGRSDQKELLGGKGAGLAEMSGLGLPVPPGFTITTEVCKVYHREGQAFPAGFELELTEQLARLEGLQNRKFGDRRDPLLVSVRSGGPVSMPGMMDTVLNLGVNGETAEGMIEAGMDARFVWDCYRRLLAMYGDVVLEVPHAGFERILVERRTEEGVATDSEISAAGLREVTRRYLDYIRENGRVFPQDPMEQLYGAVKAVVESWNNRRAREYRRIHGLPEDSGTGVNVQAMVFGNRGEECATGVAFTRDPSTGEKRIYGEYLVNAQGEDVVAGTRTPQPVLDKDGSALLGRVFPEAYSDLVAVCEKLEQHRGDMQDVEFTIEDGKLYMLQTRDGKRTGLAAVRIGADMVAEGLIDHAEALKRVEAEQLVQMLAPVFDRAEKEEAIADGRLLARGLAAGPGAASGKIALSAERAASMALEGPVLLVREETSPEDIVGMHASAGILTSRGGMTSHAAVVARGLGKPCIVGAGDLVVDEEAAQVRVDGRVFAEGEDLSMDGSEGQVIAGRLEPRESEVLAAVLEEREVDSQSVSAFRKIVSWADDERRMKVRANADTPHDARVARALGAEGIGLCRTEHMFFEEERIPWVRRLILARSEEERSQALARLLPVQQDDFEGIFEAMDGLPVTVRLLDPPLHEFLPHGERALAEMAVEMGTEPADVAAVADSLAEFNPMLGNRGCRLGLTTPGLYEMQVEAITRAVAKLSLAGHDPRPEIMVPLVGASGEMEVLRERAVEVVKRVQQETGTDLHIPIGTMIEIPRAALIADRIAAHADFFSFGTNDLTQMAYGYSRDDSGRFLPHYVENGILPFDPFEKLDQVGVGQLVAMACERGRQARADLKMGVCGEHGGEPESIGFFDRCGLDYVSCSPYRVPIARLASARATLGHG